MPRDEFDAYRDTYVDTVEQSINFSGLSHDFFQHSKALMLQDLIAKRLPDTPRPELLDVGCGVGALHPYIAPLFGNMTGVDVSVESIDRARIDNPAHVYESYDGKTLPFDTGSFDMTLAICVMHHVPTSQWENFMSEMARVVKPGGMVCLIEHNPINPATRLSVARCPFDADAVLIGTRNMRRRMRAAGLNGVSTRNFVFFPSNAPTMRGIEQRLHWLPLGAQYAAVGRVA